MIIPKEIVGAPLVGALNPDNALQQEIHHDRAGEFKSRAGTRPAPTVLGDVIGMFKSITTHQYSINVHLNNWQRFQTRLWQRNYYEHIIRNENELHSIREYIMNNPLNWKIDKDHPENL